MSYRDPNTPKMPLQLLMDISATLAEHTRSVEQVSEIPGYLGQTLELEPLTIAIVREGEVPMLLVQATSATLTGDPAAFTVDLLSIYQQTRPLSVNEAPALRTGFALHPAGPDVSQMAVKGLDAYPRAAVFTRPIDDTHRLLLIVHQRPEEMHLSAGVTEVLQLVASQLAKLLASLVIWLSRPEAMGEPFNRLTEREWMVMRNMNSDAGEKQLAEQLGLSPHTLHSHIKSIYRKVGVQGRLSVLMRAEGVMRGLRRELINRRASAPMGASAGELSAVAG